MVSIRDLISERQERLYEEYYAARAGAQKPHRLPAVVRGLVYECGAHSVLDYGCGDGRLFASLPFRIGGGAHTLLWVPFYYEYDPAIPGKHVLPEPADLVVCLDVLEHVESEKLERVVLHILSLARKALLITVACKPSGKVLPDGSNQHQTVQEPQWWHTYLTRFADFTQIEASRGHEYAALWRPTW